MTFRKIREELRKIPASERKETLQALKDFRDTLAEISEAEWHSIFNALARNP